MSPIHFPDADRNRSHEASGMKFQPELNLLYSREEVENTIKRLAEEITRDYQDKNPVLIGVLKGSFLFMADLIRHLDFGIEIEFIRLSSYGKGKETSGKVTIAGGLRCPIKDRDVLLIEDIVDTGLTLKFLMDYLGKRKPASLKTCVFLDKPSRRKIPVFIDYTGLTVPDKFVVGFGIDWGEKFRNLPGIFTVED
jgi:hypoxanthine phosphoribosyltransferase